MSKKIYIQKENLETILNQLDSQASLESCGLIAGKDDESLKIYPITNILNSSTRYRMSPKEQIKALIEIEENGWELLAIYHSHPSGPPHPSITDIAEASYPDSVYIIFSPENNSWTYNGFIIGDNKVIQVEIVIT